MWRRLFSDSTLGAIGGPLGTLARNAIDRVADGLKRIGGGDAARDAAFTVGVITLGAKMAKVDGRVTAPEVIAFREVFHVPDEALDQVGRIFDRARRDAEGYEPYARQIAELFADQPDLLEQLLIGLFRIAKADGAVSTVELDYLAAVAAELGIEAGRFEQIRAVEVTEWGDDPFAVLGLTGDADAATVKRAYLEQVRRHHPDRLAGAGLPPEFVAQATARLAAVNAAYRQIARARLAAATIDEPSESATR